MYSNQSDLAEEIMEIDKEHIKELKKEKTKSWFKGVGAGGGAVTIIAILISIFK
jgi:hypothetical protein